MEIKEATNSREALQETGLDWQVLEQGVYGSEFQKFDGYKGLVTDAGQFLSIQKQSYQVIQNAEAFEVIDGVLGETNAHPRWGERALMEL